MKSRDAGRWLTLSQELPGAELNDLRRTLVTCDGRGLKFKDQAFREVLNRALRGEITQAQVNELYGVTDADTVRL